VFDWLTHRADMPLWPGGPKSGLGLWNHPAAETVIEVALFIIGVVIYERATRPRDRTGSLAFWSFVVFLAVIHAMNLLGPPPPKVEPVMWAGLLMWLFPLWSWWLDRHREARA